MTDASDLPPVLSVGRLYCDLIFTDLPRMPTLGTEVFTDGFGAHAGGGAFITAAHLAQLGHRSSLAAMLPASPFGDLMRSDLEASQIDLSLCAPLAAAEGPQITVAMAQDADRSFLTRRAGHAFPKLRLDDIAKRGVRHVHIGEITSLIARPEILHIARAQGATVSADCGWDDDFDASALAPFVGALDVFLPNETEMDLLQSQGIGERFATLTVIKRGAKGASVLSPDGPLTVPAIATDVVDTTGAGDAFNAGFLSQWLNGGALQSCLAAGNRRGALSVATRGGFAAKATPVSAFGLARE
ncbi:MAG: carbohydrate kinase family protein [Pseudomonadota bacterium]